MMRRFPSFYPVTWSLPMLGLILILGITGPLAAADSAAGSSDSDAVRVRTLDNGMRVLVKVDRRAPVAVSQVWYAVGSSYEPEGLTGISHVLEHMMFKGTETLGPGEFSERIARAGGRDNAFTGRDYTAYYQRIANDRLELCLRLEADRMRNLRLDPEQVEREIRVVQEERRLRVEDDPKALTREQFRATAFLTSPYRQPVIGWMDDLESLKTEALERWYAKWYAPNNAALVVVGDVDPEHVFALAEEYFGSYQPSDLPARPEPVESPQYGPRRVTVRVPAEVPYLTMGFKIPTLRTAESKTESYALAVLASVLDGGESARLPTRLVRKQELTTSVSAGSDGFARLDSLFSLSAIPREGVSPEALETALWRELEALKQEPIDPKELDRVKAQVVAEDVYDRDSLFYQGMLLGFVETVGLDRSEVIDAYVDNIQAVTAEQVQAVARKYLDRDRMTMAILEPRPAEEESEPTDRAVSGAAPKADSDRGS